MPDVNSVLDGIKRTTPKFVIWTDDLTVMVKQAAAKILEILEAYDSFPTYRYAGQGLLLTAAEKGVIRTGYETELDIQDRVFQNRAMAARRGTLDGIRNDIAQDLWINVTDVTVARKGYDECGEVINHRYEGVDDRADIINCNRAIICTINRKIPVQNIDTEAIRKRSIPAGYLFELIIDESGDSGARMRPPENKYVLFRKTGDGSMVTQWTRIIFDYTYVTMSDGSKVLITAIG
jgi:hypothetical protein